MHAEETLETIEKEYRSKFKKWGINKAYWLTYKRACETVLKHALEGTIPDSTVGICHNVIQVIKKDLGYFHNVNEVSVLVYFSLRWPDHKRKRGAVYPITQPVGENLWEGEGLAQRISLLRYIIKRIRDITRRLKD